jgi:hypothetical protein
MVLAQTGTTPPAENGVLLLSGGKALLIEINIDAFVAGSPRNGVTA